MNNLTRLSVELTNLCQLKCVQCLHHGGQYHGQADHHPKSMDLNLFKIILDQYEDMHKEPKHITPAFQGEPLLYHSFVAAVTEIEKRGMTWNITTNCMLLDQLMTNFLLSCPHFINIAFSIDGSTKSTLEAIRIGANYDRIIENIHYFIERAAMTRPDIVIAVNFVRMKENEHEYMDYVREWTRIEGIKVQVSVCTDADGMPQRLYWRPDRKPCLAPNYFGVILTDGSFIPCCRDHRYEMIMGNVERQSLKEIWEGEKYERLRWTHRNHTWDEYSLEFLCAYCDTHYAEYQETLWRADVIDQNIWVKRGPFWEEFRRIEK